MTLIELAERCEAATADAARQLIIDAHGLVYVHPLNGGPADTPDAIMKRVEFANYMNCSRPALLEAAMMLKPEGLAFLLSSINPDEERDDGRFWAIVGAPDCNSDACGAAMPALALCAAALRARAASGMEAPSGGETRSGSTEGDSAVPQADAHTAPAFRKEGEQ